MIKTKLAGLLLVSIFGCMVVMSQAWAAKPTKKILARGKYLVMLGGCNDCHTDGYLLSDGKTPVKDWLKGSSFGWQGPWGTTYPPNLRLFASKLNEDQWVKELKTIKRRPPMPWFTVNKINEKDMRAMYQFIKSLGEPGEQAPAYIPPGKEAPMPYAKFPAPPPPPQAAAK